jgi:adenine-specific DNA-methyltransferase
VINGYTTPKGVEVEGLHDNSLRYYKIDYAERDNTAANREKLLRLATDMLCVKENIYNEERQFGSLNFKKGIARYFANNDKQMLIVYEPRAIEYIVKELHKNASLASRQRPLKLYVYSDGAYAYNDEFEGLLDRVELTAMPNALIQALHNVLPEPIVDEFKEGGLDND